MEQEVWRSVLGFEDYYEVSDQGRVRSLPRWRTNGFGYYELPGRIMKLTPHHRGRGYLSVYLHGADGYKQRIEVQRLVLLAFRGQPPQPDHYQSRHLNGDPTDNRIDNLQWGTPKQNADDMLIHGTRRCGEQRWNAKLSAADVIAIRQLRGTTSAAAIAKQYALHVRTIYQIFEGRTWTHV